MRHPLAGLQRHSRGPQVFEKAPTTLPTLSRAINTVHPPWPIISCIATHSYKQTGVWGRPSASRATGAVLGQSSWHLPLCSTAGPTQTSQRGTPSSIVHVWQVGSQLRRHRRPRRLARPSCTKPLGQSGRQSPRYANWPSAHSRHTGSHEPPASQTAHDAPQALAQA